MRLIPQAIKPASGFAHFLHLALVLVLPLVVFLLVRYDFPQLATIVVILSKWRMFAVRPRFWAANVRANGVDLMVGLSIVLFMSQTDSLASQLIWTGLYGVWSVAIKPGSSVLMITVQAFLAQLIALSVLFLSWDDAPRFALVLLSGIFCFLAARHFLDAFDEPYARLLAYVWGYFAAALTWLLSHWLLFYGVIAQATLLLSFLGYGLATLYYLDHSGRLSAGMRRQFVFVMAAAVLLMLVFSDWGDKVV